MPATVVDLRSDTVTRPTPDMRRAMATAEVGDDGYGDDPTVRELEEAYADRVGKEAALLVPSGTMANQLALRVMCRPGTAVIAGEHQHLVAYEVGGAAVNALVQIVPVPDADGRIMPNSVAAAREAARYPAPEAALVCIEDTHMAAGGVPWALEELEALSEAAGDVPVHLDGARLFNAEVATGIAASTLAAGATTVMSCLSKGLCAPVGSLLAGPAEVIATARVERRRLGGTMRQAGILAAAGLVGLRTMVDRLSDDHERAQRLARCVLERWPDAREGLSDVRTNIVLFRVPAADAVLAHLEAHGVLARTIAGGAIRMVTHYDVDDRAIERVAAALATAP